MNLRPIHPNEDKSKPLYASADCQQLLSAYEDFYPKIGFNLPWVGYFILKEEKIVGSCGFVGSPKGGMVEIAYWTFKEYENQGIASFACQKLVSIAKETDPQIVITAKTAPEKNASTNILEKNRFVFSKLVQDEEIGEAWLWTYSTD